MHQCKNCNKSFEKYQHLKNHISKEHVQKGNKFCNECDKEFFNSKSFKEHLMKQHYHVSEHKCNFCDKTFFQNSQLKKHLKDVHEKTFQCEKCNKSFFAHIFRKICTECNYKNNSEMWKEFSSEYE